MLTGVVTRAVPEAKRSQTVGLIAATGSLGTMVLAPIGQSLINAYDNCLAYMDDQVGQLLLFLAKQPEWSNTIVIITSDHGEAFGQHAGNYGHTLFLHEENVRVPYLVVLPGLVREPIRVHRPASLG